MKKIVSLIFVFICLFVLTGCSNNENEANNEGANISRISTGDNNSSEENSTDNILQNTEEEIAKFSTKLLGSDSDRNTNISIGCSAINGTVVEPGDTFSFWKVVGETTVEKGYKKSDCFDENGNKIQALGGGLCQISTTLYNAVLKVDELDVTERHEHSDDVAYIEKGKDATVSYSSVDFKFKNKADYSIKVLAEITEKEVIIKIMKTENSKGQVQ